jgi:hypothetical protein
MINGMALCAALAVTERGRPAGLAVAKPIRTPVTSALGESPVRSGTRTDHPIFSVVARSLT